MTLQQIRGTLYLSVSELRLNAGAWAGRWRRMGGHSMALIGRWHWLGGQHSSSLMCGCGCRGHVSVRSPESWTLPAFPRDLALINVGHSDRQSHRAGLMRINGAVCKFLAPMYRSPLSLESWPLSELLPAPQFCRCDLESPEEIHKQSLSSTGSKHVG